MLEPDSTGDTSTERLPEFWPLRPSPDPARAWWIPWPIAVLFVPLLWLIPKRMGPHFAAVRWPGVIIGHIFWTIYGIACIDMACRAPHYGWIAWLTGGSPGQADPSLWPPPSAWDVFRAPLALEATWLAQEVIHDLPSYLLALGAFLGSVPAIAALGLLLTPFATAGERTRRLVARCIKLTLWSTTSSVLLGLALQAAVLAGRESPHFMALIVSICALYAAWFLWFWLRLGLRYAGPAEGPGWQTSRPTCERCGYVLTGLTRADRCPECGREVALSMPDRRKPTAYQSARGLARIPAYFRTLTSVLLQRAYLEHVSVHQAHPAARRFAIRTCLLASGVTAGLSLPGILYHLDWEGRISLGGPMEWSAAFGALWMGLFAAMLGITAATACTLSLPGLRSIQLRATVALYHTAWLLPLGIAFVLAITCLMTLGKNELWVTPSFDPDTLSQPPRILLTSTGLVLVALLAFLAVSRLIKAMRWTRYANR